MTPGGFTSDLLERLAQRLAEEGIRYCQWKGQWSAHRWATGQGEADLLVDRAAAPAFRRVAQELGFRLAQRTGSRQLSGVEHYLGYDPEVTRLLQLQVRYRLLLGEYWKPVYHIPLEHELLERAKPGRPFSVPDPTHQFLVFVLRMMLRQVGRPLLSAQRLWTTGIRIQLEALEAGSDRNELAKLLHHHLSPIDLRLFERCVRSLQGRCGLVARATLPFELHRRLRAHVTRPSPAALLDALAIKLLRPALMTRISDRRLRLTDGGVVLALVGGEGAGKPTWGRELSDWLAPTLPTMQAEFGKPGRSLLTLIIDGALAAEQLMRRLLGRPARSAGGLKILRHLCSVRDRYLLYIKVRRFALGGGIAICDSYPIAEVDGRSQPVTPDMSPGQSGFLPRLVSAMELAYRKRMLRPDVLLVLRPSPGLPAGAGPAVDWGGGAAHVIEGDQQGVSVVRRIKEYIWQLL